jgi:DEAD/DEAH box helicase domain-containing protein
VSRISRLLERIREDRDLRAAVRHHEVLPERGSGTAAPEGFDLTLLEPVLQSRGIEALYSHQARALELLAKGNDVVLATPTASGKSLVYNLPALAGALTDPDARALYLFPLKALEQDQRKGLEEDIAALASSGKLASDLPSVAIYDGDTPASRRRKIRESPPNVLISTPDMLHMGILPHHASWERLFRNLALVVIDELHTYRGVFGSQVAQVLRRLDRVTGYHGARAQIICASATVANPGELARNLTGRDFQVISNDGAARTERHVLLLNPRGSPYTTAARLFRMAVRDGLRTIAFTKARRITELMHAWVIEADPSIASAVSSYRAGFLPEERREIERRLFQGDLLGVISTSALEMGIDVGGLDVCLLVGYPGSQIATWQRAGRVGRSREALIAMIAQPDALDQYLVSHPRVFFDQGFEHAVLDPDNPEVTGAHLPCAAAEIPLRAKEPWLSTDSIRTSLERLELAGTLLRSETGNEWFASRRNPHREVNLRSTGSSYTIEGGGSGDSKPWIVGSIGSANVFEECHEGAIYLHHGRQYLVTKLDREERVVSVEPVKTAYYTRALKEKETEILSRERARPAGNFRLVQGRVKVTTRITAYERRRVRGQDLLATERLDLPPTSFETASLWLEVPDEIPAAIQATGRHVMGGIHAVEHAALSLFPLFALCDRHDVAGISYVRHPQLGRAAVFFYDQHAGGVGLAASVFERVETLLETTLELIRDCPCQEGCPSCVHSPKCGSGNRPIDKEASIRVLELLIGRAELPAIESEAVKPASPPERRRPGASMDAPAPRLLVFDLETQRSADEVGGWHNAHLMRISLAVIYDSLEQRYTTFFEADVGELLARLAGADLVIGFNVRRFDYRVLRGYTDDDLSSLPTFDLLDEIHARLGFRVSLAHLGEETLGESKSADGLQALEWWKEGRLDQIEEYCRRDVALLRDLFEHAREHGHLLFRSRRGGRVRVPLRFSVDELVERARAQRGRGPAAD